MNTQEPTTGKDPTTTNSEQSTQSLEEDLQVSPREIIIQDAPKRMTTEQASLIVDRIAKTQDIARSTAATGIVALIRKGAANAGAPDSMEVQIRCPITKNQTTITRYDIGMALQAVTGHKTIRKLAEALAPLIIKTDIKRIKTDPTQNLKGDLANKINRKLTSRGQQPLTPEEEVCCATYTQWIPDLNQIASSTRLKALLDEDLVESRIIKNNRQKQDQAAKNRPAPRLIGDKQTLQTKKQDLQNKQTTPDK
jgi:hypothetical protein